jgi:PAS domain S-box-containing protein
VTRERSTERELKQTTEFLERVIDSSLDAIVAADTEGQVLLFNRAASRIFGYEPSAVIRKMNVELLYPKNVARDVMRKIRSVEYGGPDRLEGYQVNMLDARGRQVPVRISAGVIREGEQVTGTVGIFTDIRDELRMQARLHEAQQAIREQDKNVAVAQLAGAAAHELNQPLTIIVAYAEMLTRKLEPSTPLQDAANVITDQAERMADIVRRIGRITHYETKSYVGSTEILDLDKASEEPEPGD